MERHVSLRELLVGVEGLALLRHLYDGTDATAERRLAEVRALLHGSELAAAEAIEEAAPDVGYGAWSGSYDEPGNPIVALEQPAVWSLLEAVPPGRALDAACGTGRHAAHLVALGHEVIGLDLTPEMLDRATVNVPRSGRVRFQVGDVRAIPLTDESVDLVVCGLAVSHLPDLDAGVAELARVLAPGGRLVVSALHPFLAHLGWHAPFMGADGRRRFILEHPHRHADYLAAFRDAGLRLRDCLEPRLTADEVSTKRRAYRHIPEAATEAYAGLPGVLVWSATKRRAPLSEGSRAA